MNPKAFYNLTYGLFLLTAQEEGRDNGCIINTAIQVANDPTRISIAVQKTNHTCGMIQRTGAFNVSALTTQTPFSLFQRFGMQSGRDVDKFADFSEAARSENGLYYLTSSANAYFSAKVTDSLDLGSHMLFIGEVTAAEVLGTDPSCTYGYYQSDIKPKPAKTPPSEKKRWVCKVCGYIYEGDELPDDFICPLCKHGKEDFELLTPAPVKKWVCTVCGYVHEGPTPPDICPICKVPADKFKEVTP